MRHLKYSQLFCLAAALICHQARYICQLRMSVQDTLLVAEPMSAAYHVMGAVLDSVMRGSWTTKVRALLLTRIAVTGKLRWSSSDAPMMTCTCKPNLRSSTF